MVSCFSHSKQYMAQIDHLFSIAVSIDSFNRIQRTVTWVHSGSNKHRETFSFWTSFSTPSTLLLFLIEMHNFLWLGLLEYIHLSRPVALRCSKFVLSFQNEISEVAIWISIDFSVGLFWEWFCYSQFFHSVETFVDSLMDYLNAFPSWPGIYVPFSFILKFRQAPQYLSVFRSTFCFQSQITLSDPFIQIRTCSFRWHLSSIGLLRQNDVPWRHSFNLNQKRKSFQNRLFCTKHDTFVFNKHFGTAVCVLMTTVYYWQISRLKSKLNFRHTCRVHLV